MQHTFSGYSTHRKRLLGVSARSGYWEAGLDQHGLEETKQQARIPVEPMLPGQPQGQRAQCLSSFLRWDSAGVCSLRLLLLQSWKLRPSQPDASSVPAALAAPGSLSGCPPVHSTVESAFENTKLIISLLSSSLFLGKVHSFTWVTNDCGWSLQAALQLRLPTPPHLLLLSTAAAHNDWQLCYLWSSEYL